MKLRTDSWIAKVARVNEKYISDECSLYRALTWELLVRFVKFVLFPVLIIFGATSIGVFAYEIGSYPTILNFPDHSPWIDMWSETLGIASVPLLFAAVAGLMVASLVPVAIGMILICGGLFLIWEHMLARLIKKSAEATAGTVIATGIRNWHQGICRRVELVNPNLAEGFGVGARILIEGKVEGIVSSLENIDHRRGKLEFRMDIPILDYFHHYGLENACANVYRYVSMKDVQVLESAKTS